MRPTEAGRALYARVRRAIDEARAGFDEVAAGAAEPIGTLRIGVLSHFSDLYVVPALAGFLAAHPKVSVTLVESERPADLVGEELDLSIRLAMTPDPTMIARRIGASRVIVCAAPAHLAARGAPTHPGDIAAHPRVAYARLFWEREWRFDGPEGPLVVPVRPALVCPGTAAALAGVGLVALPEWAVRDDLDGGALVRVLADWRMPGSGVFAVYPSNRLVTPGVRICVDHIARHLRARLGPP